MKFGYQTLAFRSADAEPALTQFGKQRRVLIDHGLAGAHTIEQAGLIALDIGDFRCQPRL